MRPRTTRNARSSSSSCMPCIVGCSSMTTTNWTDYPSPDHASCALGEILREAETTTLTHAATDFFLPVIIGAGSRRFEIDRPRSAPGIRGGGRRRGTTPINHIYCFNPTNNPSRLLYSAQASHLPRAVAAARVSRRTTTCLSRNTWAKIPSRPVWVYLLRAISDLLIYLARDTSLSTGVRSSSCIQLYADTQQPCRKVYKVLWNMKNKVPEPDQLDKGQHVLIERAAFS